MRQTPSTSVTTTDEFKNVLKEAFKEALQETLKEFFTDIMRDLTPYNRSSLYDTIPAG